MPDPQSLVTVYSFRQLSSPFEMRELAAYKATLQTIADLGGEPLLGTAEEVQAEALDRQGRYRRVNTGWGGLG